MKKLYTLITAIGMFSIMSYGQQRTINNASLKLTNQKLRTTSSHTLKASLSGDRIFSGWLNYALQLNDPSGLTPNAAGVHFMMIFPDTAIIAGVYTSGATAYPQFMNAATMLDPKNMPLQGITAADAYSLDSIGIAYAYLRNLPSTIVDTLFVSVLKEVTAQNYTLGGTRSYQDITYDSVNHRVVPSNIITTYTYLLHESDSSSTTKEIFLAATGVPNQAAGKKIGVSLSFKPGYSYSITDSINAKNSFYLLSYQQNGDSIGGAGTTPTYYGTATNYSSDMNCSYALPKSVRYNINANGWNGYFIPTWAWTPSYAYENHIIEFKISNPPTGIAEFENGAKLGQNIPNPFTNSTEIRYELEKTAKVTLNVFDVTGKKVVSINDGEQHAGNHSFTINSSNMSEGVYYYSINVGDNSTSTRKMVMIK